MKQHEFKTYADYVNAQTSLTRRKFRNKVPDCYTKPDVIIEIARDFLPCASPVGICHGVRTGEELDLFEQTIPNGKWIGTEITEELCDGQRIICHDMGKPLPDKYDLVYSNALDHARDPEETASVWLDQLTFRGTLYVEWSKWSNVFRTRLTADCFAASLDEYAELFQRVGGRVNHILVVPHSTFTRYVLVIQKSS